MSIPDSTCRSRVGGLYELPIAPPFLNGLTWFFWLIFQVRIELHVRIPVFSSIFIVKPAFIDFGLVVFLQLL